MSFFYKANMINLITTKPKETPLHFSQEPYNPDEEYEDIPQDYWKEKKTKSEDEEDYEDESYEDKEIDCDELNF